MRYRYFVDFCHGISVFANFSNGIAVLGTPQCSPQYQTLSCLVRSEKNTAQTHCTWKSLFQPLKQKRII